MELLGSNIVSQVRALVSLQERIGVSILNREIDNWNIYVVHLMQIGLKLVLSPLSSNIVVRTACCSVGVVLPVYSTFKAIEKKDENEQRRWLLYWAVYGSFSLVEVFSDKLLSWVPIYNHLKFGFLVWLQLPTLDGANKLYLTHLRPFFLRHQAKVDKIVGSAYGEMGKMMSKHEEEIKFARLMFVKIIATDQTVRGAPPDQTARCTSNENQARRVSNTNSEADLALSDVENTIEAPIKALSDTDSDTDI